MPSPLPLAAALAAALAAVLAAALAAALAFLLPRPRAAGAGWQETVAWTYFYMCACLSQCASTRPWTVGGSAFLCTHLPGSPRAAGRGPRP